MSDVLAVALSALSEKLSDADIDFTAKFVLGDEGSIMVGPDGVTEGDGEADVTMSADPDVFKGILDGSVNPTTAFMSGQLSVDGGMGLAMKLGSLLS